MKKIINIILIVIIILSSYKVISKIIDYKKSEKTYEKLQEIKMSNHDFTKELLKINSDYKGWIKISNTNIDYPVVQGSDNKFYLNHDFNKKESDCGAIFLDYKNDIDKDKNIIIYGHNMKNKTMFQSLMKFKDKDFWDQNNKIILYIDNFIYEYEVFSVYLEDSKDINLNINFKSNDEFIKYIKDIKEKSIYNKNLDMKKIDKLITLSTCSYEKADNRMIIHGNLIKSTILNH